NGLCVRRVESQRHRAGVLVFVEHLCERLAAVGRAIDAALRVGSIRMAEHGDEQTIGILRVNDDRADLLAVAQAEMLPRPARVGRFVNPITDRKVGALQAFAAADVDDFRVRWRDGNRPDRAGRLIVEDRLPGAPIVVRAPDAAVVDADIKDVRLARHADRADRAPAAMWADAAPLHALIKLLIERLREDRGRNTADEETTNGKQTPAHSVHASPPGV